MLLAACALIGSSAGARAQTESLTSLYSFPGYPNGSQPYGGLTLGKDGNYYGTTVGGGAHSAGTVFKMAPDGAVTVLYSFDNTEGANPYGKLALGSDGNFYGTTAYGGAHNDGTVFVVTPSGGFSSLYSFSGADGQKPVSALVEGPDGAFYGTTNAGGNGGGTIFKITTSGTLTTLHSFTGLNGDGYYSPAPLILASDGNFYGTTEQGGTGGRGTVYRITPQGTFTVLHSFLTTSADGQYPKGGLVQGRDGSFYGLTYSGGAYSFGTVYKMTPAGAVTLLHSFTAEGSSPPYPNKDGAYPDAELIQACDGYFYGTTEQGGTNGGGVLFKISSTGAFTTIHSFSTQGANTDGSFPKCTLLQGPDCNLYGTAYAGGPANIGTVYRLNFAPVFQSISPTWTNAAGPSFTLIVKGDCFANGSIAQWNGTALTTTYVSETQLKASVPASLIASQGTAKVTVQNPTGGVSAAKTFTIVLTTLKVTGITLTRSSATGVITANVSLQNVGYLAAPNVAITGASLNGVSTSTTLPVSVGNLAVGATATPSVSFPGSAGAIGAIVYLKVWGTFTGTGGKFSAALKVTLP